MTIRSRAVFAMSAFLAVAVLAAATISAQAPGPGGQGRGGRGMGPGTLPMLQRLDLTDAQKEQVRAIMTENAGQNAFRTLGKLEQDLTAAVMADAPDTAKIEQLKAAITEAESAALNELELFEIVATALEQVISRRRRALANNAVGVAVAPQRSRITTRTASASSRWKPVFTRRQ